MRKYGNNQPQATINKPGIRMAGRTGTGTGIKSQIQTKTSGINRPETTPITSQDFEKRAMIKTGNISPINNDQVMYRQQQIPQGQAPMRSPQHINSVLQKKAQGVTPSYSQQNGKGLSHPNMNTIKPQMPGQSSFSLQNFGNRPGGNGTQSSSPQHKKSVLQHRQLGLEGAPGQQLSQQNMLKNQALSSFQRGYVPPSQSQSNQQINIKQAPNAEVNQISIQKNQINLSSKQKNIMQSKLITANKPIQLSKGGVGIQKFNLKQQQTSGTNSATDLAIMRANTQKLKHYLSNQSNKLQNNQQQIQSTMNSKQQQNKPNLNHLNQNSNINLQTSPENQIFGYPRQQQQKPIQQINNDNQFKIKQNKLNKLQKQDKIVIGDSNSLQNDNFNSIGYEDEDDFPNVEDDDSPQRMYEPLQSIQPNQNQQVFQSASVPWQITQQQTEPQHQKYQPVLQEKQLKPQVQQQQQKQELAPEIKIQVIRNKLISTASPGISPAPPRESDASEFTDPEKQEFLKSESESMHKLIKELNEQAMDILYSNPQQNVLREQGAAGGTGLAEYLVIQRKLSEMKPSALETPAPNDSGGDSQDDPPMSDIQRSIQTLSRAQKILQVQREKGQLLVKPIYASIIDYNIACCNQQINNLKKCDKLLGQSIQFLLEDIACIDRDINSNIQLNIKQKEQNLKIRQSVKEVAQALQQQKESQQSLQGGKKNATQNMGGLYQNIDQNSRHETPNPSVYPNR